ncbi:MAG: ANTAR domain-containing protein [Ornithinimicrobium sp.]
MPSGSDRLAELRALVDGQPRPPSAGANRASRLHRLCSVVVAEVPACAASLTVAAGEGLPAVVVAGVGPRAEELEELQLTLGQGPGVDVQRLGRPVLEADLAGSGSRQWPAYAPAASALGVGAVFAFPLEVGVVHLGVLDVYQSSGGELSLAGLTDCLLLAGMARNLLLEDVDRDSASEVDPRWDDVLPIPELFQAQGMVMVQLDIEPIDALARIRAYAYANDQRIGDVARDIVDSRLKLD